MWKLHVLPAGFHWVEPAYMTCDKWLLINVNRLLHTSGANDDVHWTLKSHNIFFTNPRVGTLTL